MGKKHVFMKRMFSMEERSYTCSDISLLYGVIGDFFRQLAEGNISSVYVFGSVLAPGAFHDVDVAVFSTGPIDDLSLGSKLEGYLFTRGLKFPVDLRSMHGATIWARFEVIKKGKRVYERDFEEAVEIEAATMTEYLDFRYLLDLYNAHSLGRLKVELQRHAAEALRRD